MKPLLLKMRAFGSYGQETVIDFTKPAQNIFLITGNTGAGKTTIFDAIVFALYGQASSLYNKKDGVLLQSHFSSYEEIPKVEFTFADSVAAEAPVYKISRTPKHLRPLKKQRKKKENLTDKEKEEDLTEKNSKEYKEDKGTVELVLPDGSTYPEKNVDGKIEEIVGLTKEQFMQVAMIAQGEFMELLRAKTDDKKEIFRKLFNTELYERIRCILEDRKKEKEKEINIIKAQCQTEITHVTVMQEFEFYTELCECAEALKHGNLSKLTDYIRLLEAFCAYVREKAENNAKEWDSVRKALDAAKNEYTKAESLMDAFAKYDEAEAAIKKCEAIRPEIEKKAQLEKQLREAYELKPIYQLYEDAQKDVQQSMQKLEKQERAMPELDNLWNHTLAAYEQIRSCYEEESKKFHELTQRVTAALQLFERKEKAEADKEAAQKKNAAILRKKAKKEAELVELSNAHEQSLEVIKSYADTAVNKAKSETELKRAEEFEQRLEKLQLLEQKIKADSSSLSKKQKELISANEKYQEKTEFYEKQNALFLSEQAGILAGELVEGEPCKVCGSRVHPAPYKFHETMEIPTQEKVAAAKADSEKWNEKRQQKALEASGMKTALEKQQEQFTNDRNDLCALLDISTEENLAEAFADYKAGVQARDRQYQEELALLEAETKKEATLAANIKKETTALEKINKDLSDSKEILASIEAALNELENHTEFHEKAEAEKALSDAKEQFQEISNLFQQKEAENKKAGKNREKAQSLIEEYKNTLPQKQAHAKKRREEYETLLTQKQFQQEQQWQELTERFSQATLLEWQEQLAQYQKEMQKAIVKKETAGSMIKDKAKPDLVHLKQCIQERQGQFDVLDAEKSRFLRIVEEDKKVLKGLKEQMEQREQTICEHTKLDNLYRIISGSVSKQNKMDLETFVQRYYLRKILAAANRRFEKMTAGQFQLLLKEIDDAGKGKNEGLDLMVYSLVTGKKREVRTLSGGESFMAALSLALGMADQIKEGSGTVHLDMMFIDEGFGSLDEHSRAQAVRILKEMAGGDRMIGIISHVSELKQEIENQLIVTKNEAGSSVEWKIS